MGKSNQWAMDYVSESATYLVNDEGYDVVRVQRIAARRKDGSVDCLIDLDDIPVKHATTDEQWQAMVDLIAAAPEMLAMLKDVRERCDNANVTMGLGTFEKFLCNTRDAIDSVLARAEPPRTVKRKVRVEVEVEVEVPSSADGNQAACVAVDQLRDGGGTVISHRIM